MRKIIREFVPPILLKVFRLNRRKKGGLVSLQEDISTLTQKYNLQLPNDSVIIGNGPSCQQFLEKHLSFLSGKSIFCVNAFATSEYFVQVKPQFYVFADPAYWSKNEFSPLKSVLFNTYENLKNGVDWKLFLMFPVIAKEWNFAINLPTENPNIEIVYFNSWNDDSTLNKFEKYKANLEMPVCQTVTIPTLFLSLNLGFKSNFLVGVDMSLHECVSVNSENVVCIREKHFYDVEKTILKPFYRDIDSINTPNEIIKMDELFHRFSVMFKGFMELEDYSKFLNAKVYNLSPESYVDAFERMNLDDISV
jgi:hypothetical protein